MGRSRRVTFRNTSNPARTFAAGHFSALAGALLEIEIMGNFAYHWSVCYSDALKDRRMLYSTREDIKSQIKAIKVIGVERKTESAARRDLLRVPEHLREYVDVCKYGRLVRGGHFTPIY